MYRVLVIRALDTIFGGASATSHQHTKVRGLQSRPNSLWSGVTEFPSKLVDHLRIVKVFLLFLFL